MKFLALLGILAALSLSSAANELETFDLKTYHPENYGLQDLTGEVRIDDLLKRLNKISIFGKLTDVYFKIYWTKERGFGLTIEGIKDSFRAQKENLKELVIHRLEYIIPRPLADLAQGMKLTTARDQADTVVTAVDPQNKKDPNKLIFTFSADNRLKSLKIFASKMVAETTYVYGPVNGSMNKVVLLSSKADVQTLVPAVQRHLVETKIEYGIVENVVLPTKIQIKTMAVDPKYIYPTPVAFAQINQEGTQVVENILTISNYKANGQDAANFYKQLDWALQATPTPVASTAASAKR